VTKEMTAHDLLSMPIYHPTLEEGLKPALQEICNAAEVSIRNDRDTGVPSGG
jgi:dihydrolipoamide dehydrogenase